MVKLSASYHLYISILKKELIMKVYIEEALTRVEDLTLEQIIFLSLVLDENQNNNQSINNLISLVKVEIIQDLIDKGYLTKIQLSPRKYGYEVTDKILEIIKSKRDFFDEFLAEYPAVVLDDTGMQRFLRSTPNRSRRLYNKIVGKSKAKHDHIMDCLRKQVYEYTSTGKLKYMKNMLNWLASEEWEYVYENNTVKDGRTETNYGTDII